MIEIIGPIERRHPADGKTAIGPEHGEFLTQCGVLLGRESAQRRQCARIEAVLRDERHIDVAIAMAETAVSEAADEVSPDQPFAQFCPIRRRERMGKRERGDAGRFVFCIRQFSRHEALPMTKPGIHPKQFFHLYYFPGAFLAFELSHTPADN